MTVHTPRQSIVHDTIRILSAKVNLNLKNLSNRPNFFDKPGKIRIIISTFVIPATAGTP